MTAPTDTIGSTMVAIPKQPERDPDLTVTVYGSPATKGSVQAFIPRRKDGSMVTRPDGAPMVVKNDSSGAKGKAWGGDVARAVADEMYRIGFPLIREGGVWLDLAFFRMRPKGHFGTGRNAHALKDSAPAFPASRPDVDKLERAILDAVKGVLWTDDGQVVGNPAVKAYGDPERVEIRVWCLPVTVADLRQSVQPALVLSEAVPA